MAEPSSSSSSSRLLEGRPLGLWPPELERKTEEKARDWAELPLDALLMVLQKLHLVDILRGAERVCRPWRRAALDEPALWRRIDLRHCHVEPSSRYGLRLMARAAVSRSAGRCEALRGEGAVDEWVISLLEDSALSLRSLRIIIDCGRIDDWRLHMDIKKFSMLEELELSNCSDTFARTCIAVGNSCPLLKRFRLSSPRFYKRHRSNIDSEVEGITRMRGLRSLQLFAQTVSTNGLASILDNCVQLESLDIRHCFNVEMGDEMLARCSSIETLKLPGDSTDDYDLEFSAPDMNPESPRVDENDNYIWSTNY